MSEFTQVQTKSKALNLEAAVLGVCSVCARCVLALCSCARVPALGARCSRGGGRRSFLV